MCVIRHSVIIVARRYVNVYILGSVLITVICVIKLSLKKEL